MATITVATIKTRARQKADMVNSNFISDAELLNYINEAYFSWYDEIVSAFEDYNLGDPTEFTLASGVSTQTLANDFYKLVGVDRTEGGNRWYALEQYAWRRRNRFGAYYRPYSGYPKVQYRLTGNVLRFTPPDACEGSYRYWYIPIATAFTDDADTLERYNGFEEMLITDVAIKMLGKEESDVSLLMNERNRQRARMENMLIERDLANAGRIEEKQEIYFESDLIGDY